MKDRIIKFLTHENLTATKFADEIGVQRSSVSHILSGRNNPSYDFIQKILTHYKKLNAEWLILGTGNMIKKPEQMDLFASVSPEPSLKTTNQLQQSVNKIVTSEDTKNVQPFFGKEVLPLRRVEKILLFYSDKTFEEFLPGK